MNHPEALRSHVVARLARFLLLGLSLLVATAPPAAFGQSFYGSVVGTVADATGSSVPGATVTITNIGTGARRSAESDSEGGYQILSLPPGSYKVEVEKAGFK